MYASRTTQIIVGIFTLLGILAMGFLSVRLGRIEIFPAPGYTLFANFDNIAGLRNNDRVEFAGVNIGRVSAIALENNRAHVSLRINQGVEVDSDGVPVAIHTAGQSDFLVEMEPGREWEARQVLLRKRMIPGSARAV